MRIRKYFVWVVGLSVAACVAAGCGRDSGELNVSVIEEERFGEGPGNAMTSMEVLPSAGPQAPTGLAGVADGFEESAVPAPEASVFPEPPSVPKAPPREMMNFEMKVQNALRNAGYYDGPIDGMFDPPTREALRHFQKAHELRPDGIAGPKTWSKLSRYYYQTEER